MVSLFLDATAGSRTSGPAGGGGGRWSSTNLLASRIELRHWIYLKDQVNQDPELGLLAYVQCQVEVNPHPEPARLRHPGLLDLAPMKP